MQDRCPVCALDVQTNDRGEMKVHFGHLTEIRPCAGSWKTVEDAITPAQSAADLELAGRVRRRVAKLLKLADESRNDQAHEASAARKRADELIKKHSL